MFKRKSKSDKPKAKKTSKPKAKRAPAAPLQKAPTDVYTVMIIISTVAVTVGCILLLMELSRFGSYPWWKA